MKGPVSPAGLRPTLDEWMVFGTSLRVGCQGAAVHGRHEASFFFFFFPFY